MENQNLIKFKKMYLGSAEGVSKKNNNSYCFVKFLDINAYGSAEIVTSSVADGHLPQICKDLVVGDIVEASFDVQSMSGKLLLVNIDRKVADSLLYKK